MITAPLIVYGFGDQKAWGDWTFDQLPAPGDLIVVVDDLTRVQTLQVRHLEHFPSAPERNISRPPRTTIVADWKGES